MNETPEPHDPAAPIPASGSEAIDPASRPPRRAWLRRLASPILAGAVALLLIGGVGGYLLGHWGTREASTGAVSPAADGSSNPGYGGFGAGGPHGPGGFGRGGRGAAGTIDSINGSTITLTTRNGRKLTVTAANTVAVTLRSAGSVADLKPGQTVVVSGQRGSDGTITANRIDVGAGGPR